MVSFTVYKGSKSGKITKATTEKEIGPDEVLLRVTHSGLCGTDIHYKHQNMALGHEGVGVVEQVGEDVKSFKINDRAGWGYFHDTCGHCKQCLRGTETFCPERELYGTHDLDQGSMASHAVWKADYLFKIPEGLDSASAAPLMCGGATVFNVLRYYNVRSTDRVGVVGLGGLGHLAVQFAAKMGCEVVAFSGSDSKKEEAMRLGATEFCSTKGVKDLSASLKAPIDHLLVTTSAQPDWSLYLPIMAAGGTIYPLSVSDADLTIRPYMTVVLQGLTIQGSVVAPRQIHREMLDFAALHGIKPVTEVFPMSEEGVERAFRRLESGEVRYRAVCVAE